VASSTSTPSGERMVPLMLAVVTACARNGRPRRVAKPAAAAAARLTMRCLGGRLTASHECLRVRDRDEPVRGRRSATSALVAQVRPGQARAREAGRGARSAERQRNRRVPVSSCESVYPTEGVRRQITPSPPGPLGRTNCLSSF
jgi:hypothetical protein